MGGGVGRALGSGVSPSGTSPSGTSLSGTSLKGRHIGGVTRARGFFASAAWCGIKRKNKDLCLIFSQVPAQAAGVFTTNKVKAAPVIVSKHHLAGGKAQAIIANSGNANCMTGKKGLIDAYKMAGAVAEALAIKMSGVLTASTGVIGKMLPIEKITSAVDTLTASLSAAGSGDAAKSLMTTDTVPKEAAVTFKLGSSVVNIGGVAKGAGMIHPDMATMLAFITTDAAVPAAALKKALKESVEASFNSITVDGDMSTNDCVLILANGMAGNRPVGSSGPAYEVFKKGLTAVCGELAEKIVRDAEGATKFVRVKIEKAANARDAKKAANAVATSPLVKTALYGGDPNWGRIAAAAGRSGADFSADRLDIYLGKVKVLSRGIPTGADKGLLRRIMAQRDIEIRVVLNRGAAGAAVMTSDLSKKYIDINAHYTT